ncbi:DUF4065 domain-containing protein [Acinetobacter baumannii]|nr:DUF4065 domain-containing protein [Acinetobacter baumannii]
MMNNNYSALDISNLIITYANELPSRIGSLTPIKLQKILYYVYVDCLVNHKVKLFDTPIEKWKFGPVVSSVYHNFKNHGVRHIEEAPPSFMFDEGENGFVFEEIPFVSDSIALDAKIKQAIRDKVAELIDEDPFVLVERTHREEPWKKDAPSILRGDRGLIYSDQELINYFSSKAENS